MRINFLIITFLLFSISLSAQTNSKIEKKLSKLFNSGKYDKCYTKALKLNKKYPKSDIPEYYFSKVSMHQYSQINKNDAGSYEQLKKAVSYSLRLPDTYSNYKKAVQDSLRLYVFYLNDSVPGSKKQKTAQEYYTKKYKDTLDFPVFEEIAVQVPVYKFSKSTIDSLRFELVKFAEKQDGIKYSYAGEKPETGFDCSGFTKYVYGHIGIELPHNAHKQSSLKGTDKPLEKASPGDLIFFGAQNENGYYTAHAGIVHTVYKDDIEVIHCVSGGVSVDGRNSSWEHYWKDKVLFIKTVPELEDHE